MNRQDCLTRAGALISGDRHDAYGDFADTAECLAGLWSAYLGHEVRPRDVGYMLALLKIMRLRHGPHEDSSVDACGYLALGGEVDSRG
ncbi:MAG: DUF6378 domain-containing protein [bacterium]|nr:DUF6378 domain-containing protein [bacterium]